MSENGRKIRIPLRKNRGKNPQNPDLTRKARELGIEEIDSDRGARVSGKGNLSRYRTVIGHISDQTSEVVLDIDESKCLYGRVLTAAGANSFVRTEDGRNWECTTRRVVRTIARDERAAVVTGDWVWFQPSSTDPPQGVIERVQERTGVLSRFTKRKTHILATNVDQVIVVVALDEPPFKPGLIDRYLISAEISDIPITIVLTKVDLVDESKLQSVIGNFCQLGYQVIVTSIRNGIGISPLRSLVRWRTTVITGQSGVGKSSLLNALQPGLELRVREVSLDSTKGKHTTTLSALHPLDCGGWVVDTPGIRQFTLSEFQEKDIPLSFREFRAFASRCRFSDCTHAHEGHCGVKWGVDQGLISRRRFESYLRILSGAEEAE